MELKTGIQKKKQAETSSKDFKNELKIQKLYYTLQGPKFLFILLQQYFQSSCSL